MFFEVRPTHILAAPNATRNPDFRAFTKRYNFQWKVSKTFNSDPSKWRNCQYSTGFIRLCEICLIPNQPSSAQPAQLARPARPAQPGQPAQPAQLVQPAHPAHPASAGSAARSVNPARPRSPAYPAQVAQPAQPAQPVQTCELLSFTKCNKNQWKVTKTFKLATSKWQKYQYFTGFIMFFEHCCTALFDHFKCPPKSRLSVAHEMH